MSYSFVNNRNPISDPNTDLNFNNDVLYQYILGDEAMVNPKPYSNADQTPRSTKPKSQTVRPTGPSYNIFLLFILFAIIVVLGIYMINDERVVQSKPVPNKSNLFMSI